MVTAIVWITPSARPLAETLAEGLGGEAVHAGSDTGNTLRALFTAGRPIVALCASGILIRILAPLLADKHAEPPVVAVAEDGSAAVPLIGGHHGANTLARRIAALTGGFAAVTTASDLRLGVALDEPPPGYTLANPHHAKPFAARLLAGEPVRIEGTAPWLDTLTQGESGSTSPLVPAKAGTQSRAPTGFPLPRKRADGTVLTITVTPHAVQGAPDHLVYHPRTLTLGVGCERGVEPRDLITLVRDTLAAHDLDLRAIAGVFSLDLKSDEAAVHALATDLGVPARFFSAARLNEEAERLAIPSDVVLREVGCPGVAEGAALAAAGPQARLVVEKTRGPRATCALAQSPAPLVEHIDTARPRESGGPEAFAAFPGRPRGKLSVVGIGPGSREWLSPAAATALTTATDWVGYDLYLDLVAHLSVDKTEHRFPLGAEETRVRKALALAGEGRNVALVSSGDAGIYAMGSLACELLDRGELDAAATRAALDIIPGISAFQAAAARAGALIGHDFCCISLSDLLTPWEAIEKRLEAAAHSDLVTALYNPRSARRTDQLARAMAIFEAHRPPDTPVIVASNLGRPDERLHVVPLSAFDPATVDMLTIVLVGSSESRAFTRGDGTTVAYTPRGYAGKTS